MKAKSDSAPVNSGEILYVRFQLTDPDRTRFTSAVNSTAPLEIVFSNLEELKTKVEKLLVELPKIGTIREELCSLTIFSLGYRNPSNPKVSWSIAPPSNVSLKTYHNPKEILETVEELIDRALISEGPVYRSGQEYIKSLNL